MRHALTLTAILLLSACGLVPESTSPGPVDAKMLGPMSGREQALLLGAQGAEQSGNTDAAERDYMSAIAASDGRVDAHLGLAQLYLKQQQPEKAVAILERARALQPEHAFANYLLGKIALGEGHHVEALEFFERGLEESPSDLDLLTAAAITQDMLGQHSAAQRRYQRAINGHAGADLSGVRTNLGMSYLLSNEPKKAVEVLKPEASKPSASAVTRHNLALAYGLLGKNSEAKQLVHGELDEESRQLAIARLKEYVSSQRRGPKDVPIKPPIAGLK